MSSVEPSGESRPQPPVGIDLGTTYSLLAYLDSSGRPTTVPNSAGDLLTPSAVLVDIDNIVVGKEAMKGGALAPDAYAECFKRDMGNSSYRCRLRNLDVPPEILSAFVLERLRDDAQRKIGPIREVVITVPAFFDETRRKATQDAGRLAGLDVLDIINEPTAAALAFGYRQGFLDRSATDSEQATRILVYDLGGGTFDVTILEIQGGDFRALATDGDVMLGGKDFDERLVNHVAERFLAEHGLDPRSDPRDAAQLWLDAQEAKHALSERTRTTLVCFHAGIRLRVDVTRAEFEEMSRNLLERTASTTDEVIRQARLTPSQIDRVLLVGGSSRMPMVRRTLQTLLGKEPDCSESADEAVAHGAALYAGILTGRQQSSGQAACKFVNVNSHSLGIVGRDPQTQEKRKVVLIPKNSSLPCRAVRQARTSEADQRSVVVQVLEGEGHRPEDCISLGTCVVRDLPPGLPKGTPVEVEVCYADNGRISVSARIPSIRQSAHVEIEREHARQLEDLKTWRARLCGLESGEAGGFLSAAAKPVDAADPASVKRRLDVLYVRLGQGAVGASVPDSLLRSQGAARSRASECARARALLSEAEGARQSAASRAETIRLDASLAQARTESRQAQTQSEFAHLVLGRECADAGYVPPGCERESQEIHRLRQLLKSL